MGNLSFRNGSIFLTCLQMILSLAIDNIKVLNRKFSEHCNFQRNKKRGSFKTLFFLVLFF